MNILNRSFLTGKNEIGQGAFFDINICINSKGIKVVEIDKIKFKGKRKIDWRSVGEN